MWLTLPVAIAEAVAVRALAAHGIDSAVGVAAAGPLRTFLKTSPTCGGRAVETTARACCGGTSGVDDTPETPVLACAECDAVVSRFDGAGETGTDDA